MKYLAILLASLAVAALIAAIWFPQNLGQLLLTAAVSVIGALIFAAVAAMQADAKELTK